MFCVFHLKMLRSLWFLRFVGDFFRGSFYQVFQLRCPIPYPSFPGGVGVMHVGHFGAIVHTLFTGRSDSVPPI